MSTKKEGGAILFWQTKPYDGPPRALRFVARTLGTSGLWAGVGLSFIFAVTAILKERVDISLVFSVIGVFLFIEFLIAGRSSECIEVDHIQGTVRRYSPMIWEGYREEFLADFVCVDIVDSYNEGPVLLNLVMERRESPRSLIVICDGTLENLRSPAQRLAAATNLPLGRRAQRLLDATSAGTCPGNGSRHAEAERRARRSDGTHGQ
jgi:hypothetical protein